MKEVTKRHKSFCKAYRGSRGPLEGLHGVQMSLRGRTGVPDGHQRVYMGSGGLSEGLQGFQRALRRFEGDSEDLRGLTR